MRKQELLFLKTDMVYLRLTHWTLTWYTSLLILQPLLDERIHVYVYALFSHSKKMCVFHLVCVVMFGSSAVHEFYSRILLMGSKS